ncbi:hypothetical protein PO860_18035 [Rhizobium sp. BJ04]|uniref:hypothetical protein n=1 Tax=Rhizobium binxianense TaxID=3024242 RepID=UPI0023A9CC95|nr:hypothetical protein [Rhizobium sp. BJ04]WEA59536.1 hypothetical protein PO860_18035 [Rhizobium sp. BJ04]
MAKSRLSQQEIETIVALLTSWSGVLRWEKVVDRVEALLKRSFTRQGLDKHESIRIAFKQAKKRSSQRRSKRETDPDTSPELASALRTIANLRAEIKVLKAEKALFMERFATWTYNARSRGISERDLNAKLPLIDRRHSEKTT